MTSPIVKATFRIRNKVGLSPTSVRTSFFSPKFIRRGSLKSASARELTTSKPNLTFPNTSPKTIIVLCIKHHGMPKINNQKNKTMLTILCLRLTCEGETPRLYFTLIKLGICSSFPGWNASEGQERTHSQSPNLEP